MAHQPELPEKFVCSECQTVYAGTPHGEGQEIEYESPKECAACGNTEFIEFELFPEMELE